MRIRRGLAACVLCTVVFAADWPEWRGPARDGIALAGPGAWPEKLKAKWRITIGEGHSSPIYATGKIFQFSRLQGKEMVSAIDPVSGKLLWQQSYDAPYKLNPAAVKHGQGPKSTPVYSGGNLYTLGIGGILSCWDAQTGKQIWRKDFSGQYSAASPLFGAAMSPILDRGLLIAHVGGNDDGALSAFDAATGQDKWTWKGDGPGYASPIVVELAGARQVVTQSQKHIVSVDAKSGELLWKIPFETPYVQNIVTPVVSGNTLILSGLNKGAMAVRPEKKGAAWAAETLWQTREVSMYMSSPVLAGGMLFGFSHIGKGQFFCLDPKTGKVMWKGEPRQGDNAAITATPEHLLILKSDGELVVAKSSATRFEPVRKYTVAESATWAHPLLLEKGIVVKDATTLALWGFE